MVNYSNSKIYKIVPTNGDDICYIGSTTKQYLSQRMDAHRSVFKQWQKNNKAEKTSSVELFDKYGLENCKIVLIENFPCNSKDELEKREGEWIKKINCINKRGAGGISISGMVGKERETIVQSETELDDNISVLSTDTTIVSINYQSDTEMEIIDIPKPDSSIGGLSPKTGNAIPSDEYLINLRNEYMKYQHLYEKLDKKLQWDANNANVDLLYFKIKHSLKFTYILVDLRDVKLPVM
jgi:hypothetical protein